MASRRAPERVAVGEVVGCHGLRGELKVRLLTDDPARFAELERVFLDDTEEERAIESSRVHKGHVLLRLAGCNDRDAAEALRGRALTIPREERRELPEGRFYHDDLVGLPVVDPSGAPVGEVIAFDEQSGAGLLVLRLPGGGRLEVPFAEAWVPEVDMEAGRVVVASGWRNLLHPVDA